MQVLASSPLVLEHLQACGDLGAASAGGAVSGGGGERAATQRDPRLNTWIGAVVAAGRSALASLLPGERGTEGLASEA